MRAKPKLEIVIVDFCALREARDVIRDGALREGFPRMARLPIFAIDPVIGIMLRRSGIPDRESFNWS
jgi:hypothetical protein